MTQGLCKALFIGGRLDQEEIEIPPKAADEVITSDSETFFVAEENGAVSIYKGKRSSGLPWISFSRYVYKKGDKNHNGVIEYSLDTILNIERCQALTKKGKQCGNEAKHGSTLCNLHLSK